MNTELKRVQRIGRRSVGLGVSSLWLTNDYLLQVVSYFVSESYQRFYFRQIQAVVHRQSSRRLAWNIVWGGCAGIGLSLTAAGSRLAVGDGISQEGRIVLWILAGLAALVSLAAISFLIINLALGPTCQVYLQTPYGLQRLSAPSRLRQAEALIAALREKSMLAASPAPSSPSS